MDETTGYDTDTHIYTRARASVNVCQCVVLMVVCATMTDVCPSCKASLEAKVQRMLAGPKAAPPAAAKPAQVAAEPAKAAVVAHTDNKPVKTVAVAAPVVEPAVEPVKPTVSFAAEPVKEHAKQVAAEPVHAVAVAVPVTQPVKAPIVEAKPASAKADDAVAPVANVVAAPAVPVTPTTQPATIVVAKEPASAPAVAQTSEQAPVAVKAEVTTAAAAAAAKAEPSSGGRLTSLRPKVLNLNLILFLFCVNRPLLTAGVLLLVVV